MRFLSGADDNPVVLHAAEEVLRDAAMDHHPRIVESLGEHLAVGGQIGQHAAVVDAHLHVDVEETAAQGRAHRRRQVGHAQAGTGTDGDGVGIAIQQAVDADAVGQGVDLVEHQQRVLLLDAEFFQHLVGRGDLLQTRPDCWRRPRAAAGSPAGPLPASPGSWRSNGAAGRG